MLGNYDFDLNAFRIGQYALSLVQDSDFEFLGNGNADFSADDHFVDILNRSERDVLRENPALSIASETVTLASAGRTIPIPTGVYGTDVLYLAALGDPYPGRVVRMIPTGQGVNLDYEADYHGTESDIPADYAFLDETAQNIVLSSNAPAGKQYEVYYRTGPRRFTTADLGVASVVYSRVPTDYMDAVGSLVAQRMALAKGDMEKAAALLAVAGDAMNALGEALVARPGDMRNAQFGRADAPQSAYAPSGGRSFASLAGRRR